MPIARICDGCGNPFKPLSANHRACSNCSKITSHSSSKTGEPLFAMTVGAISELIAGADLLRLGYAVFRALSPSCPCDLIAMAPDGTILRIEVRTGTRVIDKLQFPTRRIDNGRHDHHAVVTYDGDITTVTYLPKLPNPE